MMLAELARWLEERRSNCVRIAEMKDVPDKIAWWDDETHFAAAIAVVDWASDHGLIRVDSSDGRPADENEWRRG